MTHDGGFKRLVRARMRETGTGYQAARAQLRPEIAGGAPEAATRVRVPMRSEYPMVVVDAIVTGPSGSFPARLMVKTAGGSVVLTSEFAEAAGLDVRPTNYIEHGTSYGRIVRPGVTVGGLALDLGDANCAATLNASQLQPGDGPDIQGIIPGSVLKQTGVVFDFAERVVEFGPIEPSGQSVEVAIHPRSGFPTVTLERDGRRVRFLLDTGMAYTLLSTDVTRELAPQSVGGAMLQFMWGALRLRALWLIPQPMDSDLAHLTDVGFEGFLCCDALVGLRLEIDYPAGRLYVSRPEM